MANQHNNTAKSETISDEFLSKTDKEYIAEIVTDWLSEHGVERPTEIAYSITVEWKEQD